MITASCVARLPQVVADAIAAGEVVERPASVVKELVENALDAGAQHISVSLHCGGLIDIEVWDDGGGIAADDLELALARHATSKITTSDDLTRVRTLGFRGEALASIGAVSDLTLVSRDAVATAATQVRMRFGSMRERSIVPAQQGTRVHVSELFATTPARLRFLHSAAAESAAVGRAVTELALLHPEVAVTCVSDDRVQLRTHHRGTLRDALRAVYGSSAADLIEVEAVGSITVTGMISTPHAHRGRRSGLVVGVNRRRVHHRGVQVAVEEAYRGLIPSNRYPYGVLLIDIDPADVDVNVHPTKREVRFRDERQVFAAVQRACWSVLQTAPVAPGDGMLAPVWNAPPPLEAGAATYRAPTVTELAVADEPAAATAGAPPRALAELRPLRALGQAAGTWITAEAPGAVVIVDPHAAHEKAIYHELLERWSEPTTAPDVQLLLMPAIVPADPAMLERLGRHGEFISACGFDVEPFGPDALRCTAIPVAAAGADPERLVVALLDAIGDDGVAVDIRRHRIAALVACHSAVRFGDRLTLDEQQRLLDRLVETPGGITCPHGRPAVRILDDAQLRRAFGRPPA
ncbi:MAG: DNA mismatch repair endonuclease MutL [Candidatus Dormibacteria bacterium]